MARCTRCSARTTGLYCGICSGGLRQWGRDMDPTYKAPETALALPERALQVSTVHDAINTKYYQTDYGAALFGGMLVHGPGASELLGGVRTQDGNSAVFACLIALAMGFFEPAVRVYRTDGQGKKTAMPNHPLQQLLDNPNPVMTSREVWSWVAWQLNSDGNAYLRKVRAGNELTGNVVQLWPVSPFCIEPITEKGSLNFLDYYKHAIGPGKWEAIEPANIIHFKLGIDDSDHRLGCAPIKRLIREIAGDEEAARFATQLLQNSAVPGLVVEFANDVQSIDSDKAEELKHRIAAAYGGQNRGRVGVLAPGATMKQMGFSPEQMNLEMLHNFPETRIAAVMRVPPAVAQLGVGLMQTSNYSSFHEVREMFTEQSLVPMWTLRDAKLMSQLWPDFVSDRSISVQTDLSDVRALQQDEDAKYKRLDLAVQGGWITVNEARTDVGLSPVDGGDELKKATPAAPASGDQNAPPTPIGSGRRAASRDDLDVKAATLDNLPDRLLAIVEQAQEPLTTQLERFQEQQHQRVRAAVGRGQEG